MLNSVRPEMLWFHLTTSEFYLTVLHMTNVLNLYSYLFLLLLHSWVWWRSLHIRWCKLLLLIDKIPFVIYFHQRDFICGHARVNYSFAVNFIKIHYELSEIPLRREVGIRSFKNALLRYKA